MNELVAVEGILGTSSVDANMAEASTSQPKSNSKSKKKKKKDFIKQDGKPWELPTRERRRTTSKENVSIVVKKDIGTGIVQNSRLPIIRV